MVRGVAAGWVALHVHHGARQGWGSGQGACRVPRRRILEAADRGEGGCSVVPQVRTYVDTPRRKPVALLPLQSLLLFFFVRGMVRVFSGSFDCCRSRPFFMLVLRRPCFSGAGQASSPINTTESFRVFFCMLHKLAARASNRTSLLILFNMPTHPAPSASSPSVRYHHRRGESMDGPVNACRFVGLRRLISAFFKLTGVPMVLNTSFNVMGEPIVDSPQGATTVRAAAAPPSSGFGTYF